MRDPKACITPLANMPAQPDLQLSITVLPDMSFGVEMRSCDGAGDTVWRVHLDSRTAHTLGLQLLMQSGIAKEYETRHRIAQLEARK